MTDLSDLMQQRYGTTQHGLPVDGNEVLASLMTHRSVRAYLDTPLPAGTLDRLIAAAQSAASSSNLQAWSVIAVRDAERKARLAEWAGGQAHIRQAPLFLAFLADLSRLNRVAQAQGQVPGANDYLEMFLVAVVDAALAAQNVAAAAESMGLGTVYIGAMRNHPEKVAQEFALPPYAFAVFGMCIGYPDPSKPASIKPRLAQRAVLHHERYDVAAQTEAIAEYDQLFKAFQTSQELPTAGWTGPSATRVKGPESLMGRDRLRAALAALGFRLD
jgi:nitroreductase